MEGGLDKMFDRTDTYDSLLLFITSPAQQYVFNKHTWAMAAPDVTNLEDRIICWPLTYGLLTLDLDSFSWAVSPAEPPKCFSLNYLILENVQPT